MSVDTQNISIGHLIQQAHEKTEPLRKKFDTYRPLRDLAFSIMSCVLPILTALSLVPVPCFPILCPTIIIVSIVLLFLIDTVVIPGVHWTIKKCKKAFHTQEIVPISTKPLPETSKDLEKNGL